MSTPEPTFDPPVDDTDTPRSRRTRRRVRRSVRVASDPRGPISVLVGAGVIAGVVLLGSVLPAQTIAVVPTACLGAGGNDNTGVPRAWRGSTMLWSPQP